MWRTSPGSRPSARIWWIAVSSRLQLGPGRDAKRLTEARGVGDVARAEAGVDEDELVPRLDQQAVRDEPRGRQEPALAGEQPGARPGTCVAQLRWWTLMARRA